MSDLRDACWEALTARHVGAASGGPGALQLVGAHGRTLSLTSRLVDVFNNGDDVFYRLATSLTATPQPASSASDPREQEPVLGPWPSSTHAPTTLCKSYSETLCSSPRGGKTGLGVAVAASPYQPGLLTGDKPLPVATTVAKSSVLTSKDDPGRNSPPRPVTTNNVSVGEALVPLARVLWERADELAAQLHYRGATEVLQQVG